MKKRNAVALATGAPFRGVFLLSSKIVGIIGIAVVFVTSTLTVELLDIAWDATRSKPVDDAEHDEPVSSAAPPVTDGNDHDGKTIDPRTAS